MKNNACSGRTSPKHPMATAVVPGLALLREDEAPQGGDSRRAAPPARLTRHPQRHPVLGSSSSQSVHGQSNTICSCTLIPLCVHVPDKVPRIV